LDSDQFMKSTGGRHIALERKNKKEVVTGYELASVLYGVLEGVDGIHVWLIAKWKSDLEVKEGGHANKLQMSSTVDTIDTEPAC